MKVLDLFCCEGGASYGYQLAGLEILAGVDWDLYPDSKTNKFKSRNHLARYNIKFPGKGHRLTWEQGLEQFAAEADLIHASPPCQLFSTQSRDRKKAAELHINLIPSVREKLNETGKPYVIENVPNARSELINPVTLSARMFNDELWVDWDVREEIGAEAYYRKIADETEDDGVTWKKGPGKDPRRYGAYSSTVREDIPTKWTIRRERLFEVSGFTLSPLLEQETEREVMSITQSRNPTMAWNKINRQSIPLHVRQTVMGGLDWMSNSGLGEALPPQFTREIGCQFLDQMVSGRK